MTATKVQGTPSTPPSSTFATLAKQVAGRRRQRKHIDTRRHVTTMRSTDWKMVYSIFGPLHAQFDFTLKGCADNEDLNSHGDLSRCSPSDYVLERDL